MRTARLLYLFLSVALFLFVLSTTSAQADLIKIIVMQDTPRAAENYRSLAQYLKEKGIEVVFIGAANYPDAARLFATGSADAMFSGSGVAGSLILKDVADPLVRPVGKDGFSTYSAVVVAPAGAPKFAGTADYFRGKKVIFTPLASSGEIYFRSIPHIDSSGATILNAASHGAAIDALGMGMADIAIVKNRVWNKIKAQHKNLVMVGEDKEENPDNTLMVSKKTAPATVSKLSAALLSIKDDRSPLGHAVREQLSTQGYIRTTKADFKHTLELLKSAGVDKSFNYAFK